MGGFGLLGAPRGSGGMAPNGGGRDNGSGFFGHMPDGGRSMPNRAGGAGQAASGSGKQERERQDKDRQRRDAGKSSATGGGAPAPAPAAAAEEEDDGWHSVPIKKRG